MPDTHPPKTPDKKQAKATTPPANSGRRQFLQTTLALAGGGLAGSSLAGSSLAAGMEGHGGHASEPYAPGTGSMMYTPGHSMMGATTQPTGAPLDTDVPYREFNLSFGITQHELLPKVQLPAFAFNGQVPGPVIRVQENDWVKVNVTNNTEVMHTVHWHGLDLVYTMDGVPMVTQDPIHPKETFVYRFQARPAGTRFYHCHWSTPMHMMSALHGAFIIESADDPIRKRFPYERDYVLMLESFDLNFSRKAMNEALKGMKRVNRLMATGNLSSRTHGFFKTYGDFLQAIKEGWHPPYARGKAEATRIEPDFFAINGKAYPATEAIKIRKGETIRVRLINGGMLSHFMHLHGHQFWKVADDGNPLDRPEQMNTIPIHPGKTADIVIHGNNPGFWTFHDHDVRHVTNNGIYPGGMLTMLVYEDMTDTPYVPSIALNE